MSKNFNDNKNSLFSRLYYNILRKKRETEEKEKKKREREFFLFGRKQKTNSNPDELKKDENDEKKKKNDIDGSRDDKQRLENGKGEKKNINNTDGIFPIENEKEEKKKKEKQQQTELQNIQKLNVPLDNKTAIPQEKKEFKKDGNTNITVKDIGKTAGEGQLISKERVFVQEKKENDTKPSKINGISQFVVKENEPIPGKHEYQNIKEKNVEISDMTPDSKPDVSLLLLEESILNYFSEFLKENDYKIKKLLSDYHKYKEEADKLIEHDHAIDTLEQVELLIERIKKIKFEIEVLKNTINYDPNISIDENYVMHLMEEYRNKFNINFDLMNAAQIKDVNEHNFLMKQLYEIDITTSKLQAEIEEKLIGIDERDKEFENFKIELDENDKTFEDIEHLLKNVDYYLSDLEDKVNNSVEVFNHVEYVTAQTNHFLDALLVGFMLAYRNPNHSTTVHSLLLTAFTANVIANLLNPRLERRTYQTVEVIDYEKEIIEGLKSIDDIFILIDDTMEKIVDLRSTFEKQFKDYDIPEYREALNKLDQLSENISKRREYLSYTKKEFDNQLAKNGVKVKKLDYEQYDENENNVEDVA